MPPVPILFFKPPTALIGSGDTILLPGVSQQGGVRGRDRRRHRAADPERGPGEGRSGRSADSSA